MRSILLLSGAALISSATAHATTITTIAYPGAANTCALGIASNNRVVGDWSAPGSPNAYTHNFFETNGSYANITIHYQGLLGLLYGLNRNSVAVGGLFTGNFRNARAFTYLNGGISLLRPPANTPFSVAMGINDAGTVVGTTAQGNHLAGFSFLHGALTLINYPGAAFTRATGIGPGGEIVGIAGITQGGKQSVIGWTLNGSNFAKIAVPGAANTYAAALDQAGHVYGFTYSVGGHGGYANQHGFILANGAYSAFNIAGAQQTFIQGATPAGTFVGCSQTATAWKGFVANP